MCEYTSQVRLHNGIIHKELKSSILGLLSLVLSLRITVPCLVRGCCATNGIARRSQSAHGRTWLQAPTTGLWWAAFKEPIFLLVDSFVQDRQSGRMKHRLLLLLDVRCLVLQRLSQRLLTEGLHHLPGL
eukprot:Skav219515  [mRNA]  locus=scaffold30:8683:10598:+ [translate_table: standard]